MTAYRLYCLDAAGKINDSHEIDATNDGEALALARQMKLPARCELWERSRFVAQLDPIDVVEPSENTKSP